jgi:hypothetical protein
MSNSTEKVIDSFASNLKVLGVPLREEDNRLRLALFEEKLPK